MQIFLNGGMSQMDTFDHKPELDRRHDQPFDPGEHVEGVTSTPGKLMKSPFAFRQYGETGRWVSDVFPHLATRVDDLAFLMALTSRTNVHGPASYLMNTGFLTPGFPCLGAWVSYGLGALSDNLPTFIVLPDPRGLPYNAKGDFSAGFLPMDHQGTIINAAAPEPIPDLFPPSSVEWTSAEAEREGLRRLAAMNRRHAERNAGDSRLETRIASYELAARMQTQRPEALDLAGESDGHATALRPRRRRRPRASAGAACSPGGCWNGASASSRSGAARRAKDNWDNHADIPKELPYIARTVDRPIAGLLQDLKARGLLDDTLVVFPPSSAGCRSPRGPTGRDHNGGTSVAWLAGAGVKRGRRPRRERPLVLAGRYRRETELRPPRHDPAPHGSRPRTPHLPPRRHRSPAHRRPRLGDPGPACVNTFTIDPASRAVTHTTNRSRSSSLETTVTPSGVMVRPRSRSC